MKTISLHENSFFIESIQAHQRLVDILIESKNEDGISELSQPKLAKLMNHSQLWISKALKRINTEDICIEMIARGKYVVHYTNLYTQGTFSEILKLINDFSETKELFFLEDSKIAADRGINVETVQLFKTYMRNGWNQTLPEE